MVVHGFGGCGKSQLVLNYIQNFRNDYSGIAWIDGHDEDSIERDFGVLYVELFDVKRAATEYLECRENI